MMGKITKTCKILRLKKFIGVIFFIYVFYFSSLSHGYNNINESFSHNDTTNSEYNEYDRYDREGFDLFGFDQDGYDIKGYDITGYNRLGYDCNNKKPDTYKAPKKLIKELFEKFLYSIGHVNTTYDGFSIENNDHNEFIESKIELLLKSKTPQEFIHILASPPSKYKLPLFKYSEKYQKTLFLKLHSIFDTFINLNPTIGEYFSLLHAIGVGTDSQIKLMIEIKMKMINLTTEGSIYSRIMSQVVEGGFKNEEYLKNNSKIIFKTIIPFATNKIITTKSLKKLIEFIDVISMDQESVDDGLREKTLKILKDILAQRKSKSSEVAHKILRNHVLDIYEKVQPALNEKIKYHLLRTKIEDSVEPIEENFECVICMEDVKKELLQEAHSGLKKIIYQLKICHDCLSQSIYLNILDNQLPISFILNEGKLSEIYINEEMLESLNDILSQSLGNESKKFTKKMINDWKTKTLLAYFRAMNEFESQNKKCEKDLDKNEGPDYRTCRSEECGNYIFKKELGSNKHYQCRLCGEHSCFYCDSKAHYQFDCETIKTGGLDPSLLIRPCPWCYTSTYKISDCNHIKCTNCGKNWHYIKGKIRKNSKYEVAHSYNEVDRQKNIEFIPPREYLVPADKDYVPGQGLDSAFPVEEGNTDPYYK